MLSTIWAETNFCCHLPVTIWVKLTTFSVKLLRWTNLETSWQGKISMRWSVIRETLQLSVPTLQTKAYQEAFSIVEKAVTICNNKRPISSLESHTFRARITWITTRIRSQMTTHSRLASCPQFRTSTMMDPHTTSILARAILIIIMSLPRKHVSVSPSSG